MQTRNVTLRSLFQLANEITLFTPTVTALEQRASLAKEALEHATSALRNTRKLVLESLSIGSSEQVHDPTPVTPRDVTTPATITVELEASTGDPLPPADQPPGYSN
jgi:hypothetical protein